MDYNALSRWPRLFRKRMSGSPARLTARRTKRGDRVGGFGSIASRIRYRFSRLNRCWSWMEWVMNSPKLESSREAGTQESGDIIIRPIEHFDDFKAIAEVEKL